MKYTIKKEAARAHEPGSRYVEVALSVPQLKPLTYRASRELAGRLAPGLRVLVPLGRRKVTGYVVQPPGESPCNRSEDYREGQRAFAERRPPEFRGR